MHSSMSPDGPPEEAEEFKQHCEFGWYLVEDWLKPTSVSAEC